MHTEKYCQTLDRLDRGDAIRAIHQAQLQLCAAQSGHIENLDHGPAIAALLECLVDAGHLAYAGAGKHPVPEAPIRYFVCDLDELDDAESDDPTRECTHQEYLNACADGADMACERHSVRENGVDQICFTATKG